MSLLRSVVESVVQNKSIEAILIIKLSNINTFMLIGQMTITTTRTN